jgi:hypothetical protein
VGGCETSDCSLSLVPRQRWLASLNREWLCKLQGSHPLQLAIHSLQTGM